MTDVALPAANEPRQPTRSPAKSLADMNAGTTSSNFRVEVAIEFALGLCQWTRALAGERVSTLEGTQIVEPVVRQAVEEVEIDTLRLARSIGQGRALETDRPGVVGPAGPRGRFPNP